MTIRILTLDGTTGADRDMLGGKAFGIDRMRALGIPVPPAFVLTTEVCRSYYAGGKQLPADVWADIPAAMSQLEQATGCRFADPARPLLISVRSGAATSMPGMMDTILNLGMTEEIERALAEQSGDAGYAADTHRRFREQFERVTGAAAPADPWEQLRHAVIAVLESWQSSRAIAYRRDRGLSDAGGTAVTVQAMVFGNLDETSGTGVLFSRNPLTGDPDPYGEWLPRGQGEDVVSGRADALPLDTLATALPDAHSQLMAAARLLEEYGRDVQDIEFTVERGTLWLLQTRSAKRTPEAVVRHAVQLCCEGFIGVGEALDRIDPGHVHAMLTPHLSPSAMAAATILATGKPACPGIATGVVVTDAEQAVDRADAGEDVILARPTTDPDDVAAMSVVRAVITELGGSTSHAAVVCREMGVPCVVGCGAGSLSDLAGRIVTVDAATGVIHLGEIPVVAGTEDEDPDLVQLTEWARQEAGVETGTLAELLRARTPCGSSIRGERLDRAMPGQFSTARSHTCVASSSVRPSDNRT